MSSSWPDGVTTLQGMFRFAQALLGNCKMEDWLQGTDFENYHPGCFLIRVKDVCFKYDWQLWPNLIEEAMQTTA